MSLSTLANIIRLKPSVPTENQPRFSTTGTPDGRTLLARESRPISTSGKSQVSTSQERKTVLLGLDFGASHTRVLGRMPGLEENYLRRCIPSAVAVQASEDTTVLSPYLHFGEEALNKGPRFQKVRPWQTGDIEDPVMARELARHVRDLMRRSEKLLCRAVVGEPALMSAEGRHHFQQALRGLFDQVVFLPRPYLAGLGLRQRLAEQNSPTQTGESLVLMDLGAGATEACLVGKSFPVAADMPGTAFGGDHVETLIQEALRQEYPAFRPDRSTIRSWKDEFGFVGSPVSTVVVKVPVDTVERQIVLTNSLRRGCEAWLLHVTELAEKLVHRGIALGERPTQIHLTGGGSRLVNLVPSLIDALAQRGIGGIRIEMAAESDQSLASIGALHAARQVREDQWERFALA